MNPDTVYVCNPDIVMREEDESGTLLFNPDTGDVLVINETGRFVWDACRTGADRDSLVSGLREGFDGTTEGVGEDVDSFLSLLTAGGFLAVRGSSA